MDTYGIGKRGEKLYGISKKIEAMTLNTIQGILPASVIGRACEELGYIYPQSTQVCKSKWDGLGIKI